MTKRQRPRHDRSLVELAGVGLAFCRAVSAPATSLEHLQFMVTPESRPLWCFPAAREALQAIGNLATGDAGVVLAVDREPSSTVAYLHVLPEGRDPKDFSHALATLTLVWCASWSAGGSTRWQGSAYRRQGSRGSRSTGTRSGLLQPPNRSGPSARNDGGCHQGAGTGDKRRTSA